MTLYRYRHEFKSNELWTEIKLVLDNFAKPLMELFVVSIYFHPIPTGLSSDIAGIVYQMRGWTLEENC